MLAIEFTEDAGFKALEADTADAAFALIDIHRVIKIVMTDVNMPGSMDGLRFAASVRGPWPSTEIIVVSGYANYRTLTAGAAVFFHKPYNIDAIVACLDRMARVAPN